jgi:DNA modification methylase
VQEGTRPKTIQKKLFPSAEKKLPNGSQFSDTAFIANKSLPLHRWVPWIAGYSSEFVKNVLKHHREPLDTVLDPFCGVGTTITESFIQGYDSAGFEINPYAAFSCKTKIDAYYVDSRELKSHIDAFTHFYAVHNTADYTPHTSPPEGFKTRTAFYSPHVLRKVLIVLDYFNLISDETIRNVFKLAFASTMVGYSNYSYEPSLGTRKASGKRDVVDYPVAETIMQKLDEMLKDIIWLQNKVSYAPSAHVFNDSFFNSQKHIDNDSISLIITSPPYLNNYHYNRNTRPQLYWLGFVKKPDDMKPLEHSNFGSFWQTARTQDNIDISFSLPESDLESQLREIRSINLERGVYGGNGWANYAARYFNDCHKFCLLMSDLLREGGLAFVVIGNSILQGVMIPTDKYLGEIAQTCGLTAENIEISRKTRVGNSITSSSVRVNGNGVEKKHTLYEAVVTLRKP